MLLSGKPMVDYFALALSHGVLLIAFWRLLSREDLDCEPPAPGQDEAALPPGRRSPRA